MWRLSFAVSCLGTLQKTAGSAIFNKDEVGLSQVVAGERAVETPQRLDIFKLIQACPISLYLGEHQLS